MESADENHRSSNEDQTKSVDLVSKQTDKLHLESAIGETEAKNLIIQDAVSEPELKYNDIGRTVLHTAAEEGNDAILKLILSSLGQSDDLRLSMVNAPIRGERKQTALHLAAKNNRAKAVEILLENKAQVDVNDENSEGRPNWTPLHYAAEKGHLDVVRLLIEKGEANIEAPDRTKGTPLQRAVRFGQTSVVEYLVGVGADVNSRDQTSIPILSYAAKAGCLQIVEFLVEKVADINAADKNSITPLHHAANSNNWDIVKFLMEKGANLNVESKDKKTALVKVVKAGQWGLAKLLMDNKADTEGLTQNQISEVHRKSELNKK